MRASADKRSVAAHPTPVPSDQFVKLWFALAQSNWTSLTLVPADPCGSSAEVAIEVAEAGKHADEAPVLACPIRTLDAFSVRTVADLQRALALGVGVPERGQSVAAAETVAEARAGSMIPAGLLVTPTERAHFSRASGGRVVISIPSVIEKPLGLAIARASSIVVVTIELGRTRLADARRTIELIGRGRIAGCVLV